MRGVAGQTSGDVLEQQEEPEHFEPASIIKEDLSSTTTTADERHLAPDDNAFIKPSEASTIPNESRTKLQALEEKVKSMMKKGQNMIPNGKRVDGLPKRDTSRICKVCGKEGFVSLVITHIETNHLQGISIPCSACMHACSLNFHKFRFHK